MVSRRHAVVSFRNGRYYLKDLGSSNGTLVNEARVALDDEVEIGHGTVVQVKILTIWILLVDKNLSIPGGSDSTVLSPASWEGNLPPM